MCLCEKIETRGGTGHSRQHNINLNTINKIKEQKQTSTLCPQRWKLKDSTKGMVDGKWKSKIANGVQRNVDEES